MKRYSHLFQRICDADNLVRAHAKARQAGLVTLDANGDFHYVIDASGSATFDITKFKIVGVQLR